MADRTFAIGDIHGDLAHLDRLLGRLPPLDARDTLVFVGDYLDRGPSSCQVVEFLRTLPGQTPARVVALRGNHEDAWLRVVSDGWPEFVSVPTNGCIACMASYLGKDSSFTALLSGSFFPPEHLEWMRALPFWYEDEHAIYVHAGLPEQGGAFQHPRDVAARELLLWLRSQSFFRTYRGKRVVFGHTITQCLPPELSTWTPEDPTDLWVNDALFALDTGCGKGGFLTALELPAVTVYESR